MHTLLEAARDRGVLAREIPSFGVSLVIAEAFYKFQSFTLEALAFLATWAIVGAVLDLIPFGDR